MRSDLRLAAVAVSFVLATAAPAAVAGELVGQTWRSTQCQKPSPPPIDRTDAQTLNDSIMRYNAYVAQVELYNNCLKAEADRDMQIIRQGFEAAQGAAIREVETTRPRGTEAR